MRNFIAALLAVALVACGGASAQNLTGGVAVHAHSSDVDGGGSLVSTKACATNFVRVAVNYCVRTTTFSLGAATATCTLVTLPTVAQGVTIKAVLIHYLVQTTGNGAIGVRGTQGDFWDTSNCASQQITRAGIQIEDDPAHADPTIVGQVQGQLISYVPPGGLYSHLTNTTGGASSAFQFEIRGYWDQ